MTFRMASSTTPRDSTTRSEPDPKPVGDPSQQTTPPDLTPGLYIVSTPIGNLRDITLRALDTLRAAELVLAEDTRTTRRLFDAYGITTPLRPYHDHNGATARPSILEALEGGAIYALVSDAGTPLISDPGYKLVREARERDINVCPVPGASALLAALAGAGLPTDRFLFAGFLPQKSAARQRALGELGQTRATLILYETGPRLLAALEDIATSLGSREVSVARELTKLFEEFRTGPVADLITHYREAGAPRGEIVLLIGPPDEAAQTSPEAIDTALSDALTEHRTKDAASLVAERFGLPRKEVYARALSLKDDTP